VRRALKGRGRDRGTAGALGGCKMLAARCAAGRADWAAPDHLFSPIAGGGVQVEA